VAALRIIDAEGLKGLNMRALGAALGVNGASLYHHFENKEAIEVAVAEYVLDTQRLPSRPDDDWRTSLVRAQVAYRDALLRHPNALPLLLRLPEEATTQTYFESLVDGARQDGVTTDAMVRIVGGLQALAIGSAIVVQRRMVGDEPNPAWMDLDGSAHPDDAATFADTCRALIEGVITKRRESRKPSNTKKRASPNKQAGATKRQR
jgi:AcrR family transcriptional regulator